ncbi:MAG: hypothetical protein M3Y21_03460 [Candidatus Eremiobacteraeota bacterium]|nr:hypothetical protein [Candidatus Eremiobacteraeota bacterium]
MSDRDAPDFAMLRAVEILAKIHERARAQPNVPPKPIDRPIILFNESCSFAIGTSLRSDVERAFGVAFAYPSRGWHTYAVTGADRQHHLLSAFYKDGVLVAAELYVPTTDRTPPLAPRDLSFRFVPGELYLGMPITAISEEFAEAVGGPGPVVYDKAFEARFPGGVAYAMAKKGLIERLALYADASTAHPA